MIKKITYLLALCLITSFADAQNYKKNAFGFGATLVDFETVTAIKNTSLGDVLKTNQWTGITRKVPGFNLDYWHALTNHIDLAARYTGAFSSYPFGGADALSGTRSSSAIFNQLDVSLNIKPFDESSWINPFLTAGIGGVNYKSDFGLLAPLGAGIQFNLSNTTYILPEVQYRLGISDKSTDHLQYSLTILQSLFKVKAAPVVLPALPVVEAPKDSDGDGVIDDKDACPSVAGPASLNGCPDTDGDGIADKDDKCINQRGTAKYSGCPVPDSDKDGINDEEDKCPAVAGLARYGGCQIPDRDNDGVNDEVDKCPDVAGSAANGGCPALEQYNFNYKNVQFATGSSVLTVGAKAELDKLVTILSEHPQLKIAISGYTDNTGKAESNMVLSQKRADAVKTYLVSKGVSADKLTATGYGIANPVADNKTTQGRAQNRRVEFNAGQ